MPPAYLSRAAKKHLIESLRNYRLYEFLMEHSKFEWALVLLFYSVLHLVQAHSERRASTIGVREFVSNHSERSDYVRNHLASIYASYRQLQTASEEARYNLVTFKGEDVTDVHDNVFVKMVNRLDKMGISWDKNLTEEERDAIN